MISLPLAAATPGEVRQPGMTRAAPARLEILRKSRRRMVNDRNRAWRDLTPVFSLEANVFLCSNRKEPRAAGRNITKA